MFWGELPNPLSLGEPPLWFLVMIEYAHVRAAKSSVLVKGEGGKISDIGGELESEASPGPAEGQGLPKKPGAQTPGADLPVDHEILDLPGDSAGRRRDQKLEAHHPDDSAGGLPCHEEGSPIRRGKDHPQTPNLSFPVYVKIGFQRKKVGQKVRKGGKILRPGGIDGTFLH